MVFARLPALGAPRRAVTSALGLVLTSACTTLLGIDGTYAVGSVAAGGETSSSGGSGGNGVAGGESASGGAENAGAPGAAGAAGEAASPGSGGARPTEAGTGGVEATDGAPSDLGCKAGRYSGSLSGMHKPSFTLGLVPLSVSGTVAFTLTGVGSTLQMKGTIDGLLEGQGAFTATLTGSYSCGTHQVSAQMSGTMAIVSVKGTLTGDLLSSNKDARSWAEREASFTTSTYGGSGTWDATWIGP